MVINLNQPPERRIFADEDCYDAIYWSIKFGVSVEQLIQAVAKVGPLVRNVERHLNVITAPKADAANSSFAWEAFSLPDLRTRRYG
jgi:hypothetical protein